jgi:hypothetical protein
MPNHSGDLNLIPLNQVFSARSRITVVCYHSIGSIDSVLSQAEVIPTLMGLGFESSS